MHILERLKHKKDFDSQNMLSPQSDNAGKKSLSKIFYRDTVSLGNRRKVSKKTIFIFTVLFAVVGTILLVQSLATTTTDASCSRIISPGASVAAEFNSMSAGQTLCLHSGVYGSPTTSTGLTKGGALGNPITLTTVPGESPATIEGEFITYKSGTSSPSNITISHLNFKSNNTTHNRVNANTGCSTNAAKGIVFWDASNIIFEYNDVSQASIAPNLRETAIGFHFDSAAPTSNVIVRYNKIHDFGACHGFDHAIYTGDSSNGQIYGNWIYNSGCSYGTKSNGDTSKGCGSGIQVYNSSNASGGFKIFSNVIDGTGIGLFLTGKNNDVYNNVISNQRGYFYGSGGQAPPVAYSGLGGDLSNKFRSNDYFNTGAPCDNCTATSSSNISSDPLFTNATFRDYTLKSGSPVAAYGLWNGDLSNGTVTSPPPSPAGNLALNKPASATSVESSSYQATNVVDGNTGTRWASLLSDPQSIQIDLGSIHTINRVKLVWEYAYGKSYQIQTSNDAANWSSIYSITTSDGGIDDLAGLSGAGRYIRLLGTERGTPWGYSLWEFEVYGSAGTTTPPPLPADTVPPTVAWITPTADVSIKGQLNETNGNCRASASDASGISKIEFYLDGRLNNTDTSAPYSCTVDTSRYPRGWHTLGVKAYDKAGNASNIVNISVKFR